MSHRIDIDRLKVVSPCVADWGTMVGDEQVRYCRECNKHVYNTAEMTRPQIENLIKITGGQFCASIVRLPDGRLLTRPDPARVRRWRASRWASALITTVLGLNASAAAQTSSPQTPAAAVVSPMDNKSDVSARHSTTRDSLKGTVFDPRKEIIAGATITLTDERTGQTQSVTTSDDGQFHFSKVEAGLYTIKVESNGFRTFTQSQLKLKPGGSLRLDVILDIGPVMGMITIEKQKTPAEKVAGVMASPFKWLKRVFSGS